MREVVTVSANPCGACSLCCVVFPVPETASPAGCACIHVQPGGGCGYYAERPAVCREFLCVWKATPGAPAALRPDVLHGVLVETGEGDNILLVEDPAYPGHARGVLRDWLTAYAATDRRYYIVVCGDRAEFHGHPSLLSPGMLWW